MSVCTGAFVLAETGYLDGLNVTTHYSALSSLQEKLPTSKVLEHIRFIDNGKVITTGGVLAGIDGSLYLVSKIKGVEVAKSTAHYMEYDKWNPEYGQIDYKNPYIKALEKSDKTSTTLKFYLKRPYLILVN